MGNIVAVVENSVKIVEDLTDAVNRVLEPYNDLTELDEIEKLLQAFDSLEDVVGGSVNKLISHATKVSTKYIGLDKVLERLGVQHKDKAISFNNRTLNIKDLIHKNRDLIQTFLGKVQVTVSNGLVGLNNEWKKLIDPFITMGMDLIDDYCRDMVNFAKWFCVFEGLTLLLIISAINITISARVRLRRLVSVHRLKLAEEIKIIKLVEALKQRRDTLVEMSAFDDISVGEEGNVTAEGPTQMPPRMVESRKSRERSIEFAISHAKEKGDSICGKPKD